MKFYDWLAQQDLDTCTFEMAFKAGAAIREEEMAALKSRLEVSDTGFDGIASRDETIRLLETSLDSLRSQIKNLNDVMRGELCAVCHRPPHVCDDPDCVPATAEIAERERYLIAKNDQLREQVAMLRKHLSLAIIGLDESWEELNESRVELMRVAIAETEPK